MTIINELRAEVATALLVNRKGDPDELLNILKACDLVFRGLSSPDDRFLEEQIADIIPTDSSHAALSGGQAGNPSSRSELSCVIVRKYQ